MFMVINKDKIVSYLISLSTVAMLFMFSFFISKKNDEIIRTSSNTIAGNSYQQVNLINNNEKNITDIDENCDWEVKKQRNITKILQKWNIFNILCRQREKNSV